MYKCKCVNKLSETIESKHLLSDSINAYGLNIILDIIRVCLYNYRDGKG